MDLKSGYPYFLLKNGLLNSYGALDEDISVEVVILGGGISGCLMAHELVKKGIQCAVVDGRHIGLGSTCASTSLLQYEIDVPLHELSRLIGKPEAERAYKLCSEAIDKLGAICQQIGNSDFQKCRSLYFSDSRSGTKFLKTEYAARRNAGFDVAMLDADDIKKDFGMRSPAAIHSAQAGKIDAYRFIHDVYRHHIGKGSLQVFDNTYITTIRHKKDGVELKTEKGRTIRARQMVYATGYEVGKYIRKKIVTLKSTYASVSKPIKDLPEFFRDTLLWNTADPYLYMRSDNGRLIAGGLDESFYDPEKRDRLMNKKGTQLEKDVRKIFPGFAFDLEFTWSGTFGYTGDGLPYIGSYDKLPNSYFALGFGGNGITFSLIAAEVIADLITGKQMKVDPIFSFNR